MGFYSEPDLTNEFHYLSEAIFVRGMGFNLNKMWDETDNHQQSLVNIHDELDWSMFPESPPTCCSDEDGIWLLLGELMKEFRPSYYQIDSVIHIESELIEEVMMCILNKTRVNEHVRRDEEKTIEECLEEANRI